METAASAIGGATAPKHAASGRVDSTGHDGNGRTTNKGQFSFPANMHIVARALDPRDRHAQ